MEYKDIFSDLGIVITKSLIESGKCFEINKKEVIENAKPLPHIWSGVYFFISRSDNEIIYIGQSKNIHSRIGGHRLAKWYLDAEKNGGVLVSFIPVELNDLNFYEAYYIHRFKPIGNKRMGNLSKDQLIREIKGRIINSVSYSHELNIFLNNLLNNIDE